jgi:hypothetical protein
MESTTVCSNCSNPINTKSEFFKLKPDKNSVYSAYLCPNCLNQAEESIKNETQNPNIPVALLLGLAGAAAGAVVWYLIVRLTGWQIGFAALLIGWLTGKAVVFGAGRKRGVPLQIISIVLTLIAMLASEYSIINYFLNEGGYLGNLPLGLFFKVYGSYIFSLQGILTILFYALAIWQAAAIPAPRKLKGEMVRPEIADIKY